MLNKSQELLLYLLQLKGGSIEDKTEIAKYEYFTDFIHFAFHNKPVSEQDIIYTKQKQGPLAVTLTDDLDILKSKGLIKEPKRYHYKVSDKDYKFSLSDEEKKTAKYVINKYGNLNYQELVSICHKQEPFLSANYGGVIGLFTAYNLVDRYPDYGRFSN